MMILNAIYFKGDWNLPFGADSTFRDTFYRKQSSEDREVIKFVRTMNVVDRFKTGHLENLRSRFIEIPYKVNFLPSFRLSRSLFLISSFILFQNDDVRMTIIVPNGDNDCQQIMKDPNFLNLNQIEESGFKSRTSLSIPKFKISSEIDLTEPLSQVSNKFYKND